MHVYNVNILFYSSCNSRFFNKDTDCYSKHDLTNFYIEVHSKIRILPLRTLHFEIRLVFLEVFCVL